jgi:hypothetical protein
MAEPAVTLLIIIHLLGTISEKPMPSMEYCEQLVAKISWDKTTFLYCTNVAAGYPLSDFSPISEPEEREELTPAEFYRRENRPRICRNRDDCFYP